MSSARLAVMLAVTVLLLCAAVCAQEAEFSVPDGWVVSPGNDKGEGEAGYRIVHEETGIEMVYVPGGTFMMGSADDDPDGSDDQRPQHAHAVDAFWIGRTEITIGQWLSVMESAPPSNDDLGDDHPVGGVSWGDVRAFCDKTGVEFPTEAQWEYAARGPEGSVYPWGNTWDASLCQSQRDPDNRLRESAAPVGSFPGGASWCGALDMAGNVWEWCADRYDPDAYKSYATGDLTPPSTGRERVVRGGSVVLPHPYNFRCDGRGHKDPTFRMGDVGFRCALSAD